VITTLALVNLLILQERGSRGYRSDAGATTIPELRTRPGGAKVTEKEYAEIEKLAQARGLNVGSCAER
jgi:hypothetical protein